MSKNVAKNRKNKWFDEDYDEVDVNSMFKKKKTDSVEVKKVKNKTTTRFKAPSYAESMERFAKEDEWY